MNIKFVKSNDFLKKGIWLYFLLIIFEGALRKWILPGLSTPLLLIRDPIAIWLVFEAWKRNILPGTGFLTVMMLLGVVGIITAISMGHGNIFVAIYGAKTLLFHFPLIFIIGQVFSKEDVVEMGKITVWITIPMAILIGLQFYSPQSAWINRGVGGDIKGGGYDGALGFYRPPGTFSFTNGASLFFGFSSTFIMYFWFDPQKINKVVLVMATVGLIAAVPFSISRTLLFATSVTVIFGIVGAIRIPKYSAKLLTLGSIGVMALLLLGQTHFFKTAVEAFSTRFDNANEVEGGLKGTLGNRYFGGYLGAIIKSSDQPFFGKGLGMGTNVGSMLLAGRKGFLIAEDEWGRVIGELGPVMGLTEIFLRVALTIKIGLACYRKLTFGDLLPWCLLSFGLISIPQGGWAQPTSLGFCVLIGGLLIGSLKNTDSPFRPSKLSKSRLVAGENTKGLI